jgi:hypothetical protein
VKYLTIRVYNSRKPPFHLRIWPGIRDIDALFHLKLYGYVLVPDTAENLASEIAKKCNARDDNLYERVADGDKLLAIHAGEAGRILWADIMGNASRKETTT